MILSAGERTLPDMTPNPWRRLAVDWPDVRVEFVDLGNRWEETRWYADRTVVVLNQRLNQLQRRAAICHAAEHLDRGAPCGTLRAFIEARVVAATARWLLPDLELIGTTLLAYDIRRAADELWVPLGILVNRLNDLTEAESAALDGMLSRCDGAA